MKVFLGGIIQGSLTGQAIHQQDYRERLKGILKARYPGIEIFDPCENHRNSVAYTDKQARQTFYSHLEKVRSADLLLAYLPQASMGTAIEIWQAYNNNVPVITISGLATNWVIRLFSVRNFETIEDFARFNEKDDLMAVISAGRNHRSEKGKKA